MWPRLSHHARRPALQPLQPRASASATTSCATSPTPTSCSPTRSCSLSPATTSARRQPARCRARPQPRNAASSSASRPWPAACEFQLGLWMHGYQWINSPHPNYTIEGLTAETHGPYCRDALAALLQGLSRRSAASPSAIHGESGVAEGSYRSGRPSSTAWPRCGRKVEIDMHAKGIDQGMIDVGARPPACPSKVSPKFWAEHMGMPYHQADIRDQEMPQAGTRRPRGLMALSTRLAQLHPLRLRRPAARRPPLRRPAPHLARHPAPAAVGRPAHRRRLLARLPLLRQRRRRNHGAAFLQRPPRLRHRAATARGYADASLAAALGLGEVLSTAYRVWGRMLYNPDADRPIPGAAT